MPSKTILEQKQQAVAELAERIKNSVSGVLVNYQGITVEDDTAMRKALREAGVKCNGSQILTTIQQQGRDHHQVLGQVDVSQFGAIEENT